MSFSFGIFLDLQVKTNNMNIKSIIITIILSIGILSMSAQNSDSVIKVKGQAEMKAVPEILSVTIPIQSKARTYQDCTNQLTSTFNDLNAALVKAGIAKEKIKSNQLSITEDYSYQERERVLVGYIGNIRLSMDLEHSQKNLNTVMNTLNNERYNFGYQVGFSLSEEQKDKMRQEAIKEAVKDARAKAETLAKALEVKLIDIKEVNYEYSEGGNDILMLQKSMRYDSAEASSGSNNIQLNPEEMTISKSVGVIWRIAK